MKKDIVIIYLEFYDVKFRLSVIMITCLEFYCVEFRHDNIIMITCLKSSNKYMVMFPSFILSLHFHSSPNRPPTIK